MIPRALALSEKYAIPVLLRPTTRVCHSRQPIPLYPLPEPNPEASFEKNPARWALPGFRFKLHQKLNRKLVKAGKSGS
jgi:indolepyruvate ferredoxin oxidoreductase alpha subunit